MSYVAYYRVSTLPQGKSSLGLAAPQQLVLAVVKEGRVRGLLLAHAIISQRYGGMFMVQT